LGSSNVSVWSLDSNIENITADFQDLRSSETSDDRVYAMFNSGGNNTGDIRQLDLTSVTDTAIAVAPTLTGVNFKLPVDHPRIRGIFMAQSFPSVDTPNMFFFDNTCPANASGSLNTYCVGIFNTADPLMSMPVREMPVQVEGISY
jgi:hypothetical protein